MTPARSLRERLQSGEALVGTFVKLAGSDAAEVVAGAGFDFAIVDREHSQLSDGEARAAVRAIRALGMPALVRVPAVDRGEINRLLEAGAAGIQLSTTRSEAQVNALRMAVRYPPDGERSISLAHAQAGYGALGLADYLAASDGAHAPLAVVQLETATTDDPLAAIVAAADVAFIGTTDLLVDVGLDAGGRARAHGGDRRGGHRRGPALGRVCRRRPGGRAHGRRGRAVRGGLERPRPPALGVRGHGQGGPGGGACLTSP